jgi:hypothetical protein
MATHTVDRGLWALAFILHERCYNRFAQERTIPFPTVFYTYCGVQENTFCPQTKFLLVEVGILSGTYIHLKGSYHQLGQFEAPPGVRLPDCLSVLDIRIDDPKLAKDL